MEVEGAFRGSQVDILLCILSIFTQDGQVSQVERLIRPPNRFLHAALRKAREEVGIDADKIEILGRLGVPTRSLSRLRVWH